jgi:hypothetical protein
MFPTWIFIIMIAFICYLLYITRPNEDSLSVIGRNQLKKLQYWIRDKIK